MGIFSECIMADVHFALKYLSMVNFLQWTDFHILELFWSYKDNKY